MKSSLKAVVGIAATVFFLWIALRDVVWADVVEHVRTANWWLLGAATLVSTLGMHIRALRWKPLLHPVAPDIAFRPRIAATSIGFAANNVFPARLGEFARAWVLARQARIPVTGAFASLVVERALDGIVLVVFLLGSMALPGFPDLAPGSEVQKGVDWMVRIVAVLLAGALVLVFFPTRTVALAERIAGAVLPAAIRRPLVDALHAFIAGLHVLRSPRLLAISVLWCVAQWAFLAMSFVLGFHAFGITEPGYLGAVFLQSLIAMAVAIPAAPGFFGVFEAASVLGLGLWGVSNARAVSFAMGFHIAGWLALTGLGAFYAARLGIRVRDLTRSEETVETAVEKDFGPDAHPA
ncbi:MAG TPA: lysylphosphatidylglycerol synthase transmembrane domain-containing protein [Longimicrobium sp.]|nr:lysylphosphatidylglycerol synthase transmembrane domain-containing protein [Longimicrobium sp.]